MNKAKRVAWHKHLKKARKLKARQQGESAPQRAPASRPTTRAKHS